MKKLFMIRKSLIAACLTAALMMSTSVRGDASRISALTVEKSAGSSSFVISRMGAMQVHHFFMPDPPRLVVDFLGAEHGLDKNRFPGDGVFVKSVRTSQFANDPDMISRVVFDMRSDASFKVSEDNQSVTVRFFTKGGTMSATAPRTMKSAVSPMAMARPMSTITPVASKNVVRPAGQPDVSSRPVRAMPPSAPSSTRATSSEANPPSKSRVTETSPSADGPAPVRLNWSAPAKNDDKGKPSTPQTRASWTPPPSTPAPASQPHGNWSPASTATPPAAGAAARRMTPAGQSFNAFAASSGLVRNKNITIDVQGADIKTVLRSMSEFAGQNIIAGPEVTGKVTAHLKNVPWRQALEMLLKSHGFGWREEYGVIRVSTIDKLTKEELSIQAAERKKDDLLPLESRILALSFANAQEMKRALKDMLSKRGSIEVEKGNNALIVTDIGKNVDKVEVMAKDLDHRIRQVEIVAKLVDVDYTATREMGIRWDALNLSSSNLQAVGDAVIDARSATPVGTFRLGTVQSWGQIQGIIDMLARENKANIISNPRIVTADNREASILVGKEIPLIVADEAGNPITELTKVGIILRVTPHVNLDNTVTLDLHPEVSELASQATVQGGVIISLSEADTRVVVGSGETAVIGGLINEVESSVEQGVPVLKDLPLIGALFKLDSKTMKKRELVIFVTPTIVDEASDMH